MSSSVISIFTATALAAYALLELLWLLIKGRKRRKKANNIPSLIPLLSKLGQVLRLKLPGGQLKQRLQCAGHPLGLQLEDAAAIKAGSAVLFTLIFLPLLTDLPGRLELVVIPALPFGGFYLLDLYLLRVGRKRVERFELQLPDVLDLICISLSSGLSLTRTLSEISKYYAGDLASEFKKTADEISLGLTNRAALHNLTVRCQTDGIDALVQAIERSLKHGSPLSDVLEAQAEESRSERTRQLTEQAAKATPKIQLIVAMLLVPSVLLQIAAALFIQIH